MCLSPNDLDFRYGSEADIKALIRHVRFALKSGHAQSGHQCLLSANSGSCTAPGSSENLLVLEKSDYAAHDVIACSLVPRSSTVAWHWIFSWLRGRLRIRKTHLVAK